MSHELLPKLQDELVSLRSRVARETTVMSQLGGDAAGLNAARRRSGALTAQLQKLELTERMLVSQAHGS